MQSTRTTTRRRPRAVLALSAAAGRRRRRRSWPRRPPPPTPGTAAEARELVQQAAQELTAIDEQVHEAELIVAAQQQAAADAAAAGRRGAGGAGRLRAAAAGHRPERLHRQDQSRVAAFLTSDSADDLVQQMTTLDMIADAHQRRRRRGRRRPGRRPAGPGRRRPGRRDRRRPALDQLRGAAGRGAEAGRPPTRPTSPGCRPPSRPPSPPRVAGPTLPRRRDQPAAAPGGAAGVAIETALAQVGDPYVYGRHRPGRLRLLRPDRPTPTPPPGSRCRTPAARSPGWAARCPRSELQPGDLVFFYTPISHVGLYIGNGMMVHARTYGSAGRGDQRGPARLPVRRPPRPAERPRPPCQWMRRPSASICTQRGDPLRPRPGVAGGVHPPQDGVPVGAVQRLELRLRGGFGGQRRGEVVGDGDRRRAGVGAVPPPVGLRRLHRGQPGRAASARRRSAPPPRRRSSATTRSSAAAG